MIIWDLHVAEGQDKNNVKNLFEEKKLSRGFGTTLCLHCNYINYNFENMYMYDNSLNQLLFSTTLICNLPKIN